MISGVEVALHYTQPDDRQHDRADSDVHAVEAGQHEERRAVDTGVQGQAEMRVGLIVFIKLHDQEDHAQGYGNAQPQIELLLVAIQDTHVGNVAGET